MSILTTIALLALGPAWYLGYRTGFIDGKREAKRRYDCFDCEDDNSNMGG